MLRRLGRIYPLHLFMLLCFIATELAKYLVTSSAYPAFSVNTPTAILTNLLLVQSWHLHPHPTWDAPAWSISAELAAYLVFPFLAALLLRLRAAPLGCIALLCLVALAVLKSTLGAGTLNLMADWGVLRCVPSFTIGIILCRWNQAASGRMRRLAGSDTLTAAAILAVLLSLHVAADPVLVVAAFSLLVFSCSLNAGAVSRLLATPSLHALGVWSYSIYLTHTLILRAWQLIFERVFGATLSTPAAIAAVTVLLVTIIATSAFTYRRIEAPGRRAINKWAERCRQMAEA